LVLRKREPNLARPYRTFGYPVVPLVFVAVACWLVLNTLLNRPVESVAGLVLIALGLPVYFYYRAGRRT
jgi:APA family basic amino acid/polyamine antiporter